MLKLQNLIYIILSVFFSFSLRVKLGQMSDSEMKLFLENSLIPGLLLTCTKSILWSSAAGESIKRLCIWRAME